MQLCTALLFWQVQQVAPAPTVLSCCYGFSECLGLQAGDDLQKATELGCPTSADGQHAAQMQSTLQGFFALFRLNDGQSIAGSSATPYGDGMPCTFAPTDDVLSHKKQIASLNDIQVNFSNGSTAVVTGATWLPAVESNEYMSILLLGYFGFREGTHPASVVIGGSNAYTGQGLQYANTGLETGLQCLFLDAETAGRVGNDHWNS